MSVVAPKPASTVVVVRADRMMPEVLLVRRNDHVAFMAGAHVFPGGRVDPADAIAPPSTCCDGVAALPGFPDLTAEDELPFRVAALRELLEEAGLLIARTADGAVVPPALVSALREKMAAGEALAALAQAHGVRLALDAVVPFAHWVTPESEPGRYDTRFFLARLPAGQTARHDAGETTELRWITPADAVALCERGEILLPPPTWTTLKQMSRWATVDELFAWAASTPIVRVQPHLVREAHQTVLTLPGDPLLPAPPGWDAPEDTRFVLQEGHGWKPIRVS